RRREEAVELRAILATQFERRAQATDSSHPDSGQWSSAHSEDSFWNDLDEELSLERQCRQLKSHVQALSRTVVERNIEIERLENRLNILSSSQVICSSRSTEIFSKDSMIQKSVYFDVILFAQKKDHSDYLIK
ncbi:unnamed protein product, partial [Thelazia callipaeda]|uniref:t-SNARE coiled-coil homology domain-containing protein n=1 Tax=Thelazia callipaeda TaxID=103827 RepID=A0A0N5CR44_THECL